jgi:hypothetical protein
MNVVANFQHEPSRPAFVDIMGDAAMHTPIPLRVIFVRSTRSQRSRHVSFAPIAFEPSHRSEIDAVRQ